MSIKEEDGGTLLSQEEIDNLLRTTEADSAGNEHDPDIRDVLSRIEQNEERITANQERIEQEAGEEDLIERVAAWTIARSIATNDQVNPDEQRAQVEDLLDEEIREDDIARGEIRSTDDDTNFDGQNEHGSAIESEQGEQQYPSPEAEALYKSIIGAVAVLLGFGVAVSLVGGSVLLAAAFVPAFIFLGLAYRYGLN